MAFDAFLKKACQGKRVVIIVDAINQFDSYAYHGSLYWLPEELPTNARIFLSAPEHPQYDGLNCRFYANVIQLKPFLAADNKTIVGQFEQRYRKKFEVIQRDALLAKLDAGIPLYLTTALEELRTLGTYEEITNRISELPPTIPELFAWILNRLKNDDGFRDAEGNRVGDMLVFRFAAFLGASRHGLSQKELVDLLDPGDPLGNVAALLQLLRPYLMRRGEFIDFYHRQFRSAAYEMGLYQADDRAATHKTLTLYFRRIGDPGNNGTWNSISVDKDHSPSTHALQEISYHAYKFAMESGNPSLLFPLTDDEELRKKFFEVTGSPRLPVELMGYSLEVSAGMADLVKLVHFMMIRANFVKSMARSYLFKLPKIVKYDGQGRVELARAMVRLIPRPDHRRIGLILMAWMLCFDPLRRLLVKELIREAVNIVAPVDACQSALLLEIMSRLYLEEYLEVISLLDAIPPSQIREKYQRFWATGNPRMRELSEELSKVSPYNPPLPQAGIEEYQMIREFAISFRKEVSRTPASFNMLETKMCENLGLNGAAGGHFLMACDYFQSGHYQIAENAATRGIYLFLMVTQPFHRTVAAMVKAFGRVGEPYMAWEQEKRVGTFERDADSEVYSPDERANLKDRRRELSISKEFRPDSMKAEETESSPRSRQPQSTFQKNHSENSSTDYAELLYLISDARFAFAQGMNDEMPMLFSMIFSLVPNIPRDHQFAFLLATYCLARACDHKPAMQTTASALKDNGIDPEIFFSGKRPLAPNSLKQGKPSPIEGIPSDVAPKFSQAVSLLTIADPCCLAAIAMGLRECGEKQSLMELLRILTDMGSTKDKIDPILCELIKLPENSASDLRQISDEILDDAHSLPIPIGLAVYYYPGLMLFFTWYGMVLMATGLSGIMHLKGDIIVLFGFLLTVTALGGAFTDILVWKVKKMWERPEISRKIIMFAGSLAFFFIWSSFFHEYLLPQFQVTQNGNTDIYIGFGGMVVVGLLFKRLLFISWNKKRLLAGSIIACLFGIFGWWAGKNWFTNPASQGVLAGLFLWGSYIISFALNFFPKHLACIKYFGKRGYS
jgi:hypothetical protein